MKIFKKLCLFSAIVILLCSLCGCELIYHKFTLDTKDTNGEDDHTLAVFTDEDICAEDPRSYCFIYGLHKEGDPSFEDEEYFEDGDLTESSAASSFSGVVPIQTTYGKEDTIKFTVECERTEGNLRIVLLDNDLNIIHDFDIEGQSSFEVTNAKGKTFEIRAAGESALFTITATREFITK